MIGSSYRETENHLGSSHDTDPRARGRARLQGCGEERQWAEVIFSSSTWPGISRRRKASRACMCGYLLPLGTPWRLSASSTPEISRNPSHRDVDPRAAVPWPPAKPRARFSRRVSTRGESDAALFTSLLTDGGQV